MLASPPNCITTVFLTSGDSALGSAFAIGRETGNLVATAEILKVASNWTQSYSNFGGQSVLVETLNTAPQSTFSVD